MVGNLVTGRQTWPWSASWELVSGLPDGSKERTRLGLAWAFGTSKYTPSNISSPTRPHLLILLSLVTIAVTKHHDQSNLGGKGLLGLPFHIVVYC